MTPKPVGFTEPGWMGLEKKPCLSELVQSPIEMTPVSLEMVAAFWPYLKQGQQVTLPRCSDGTLVLGNMEVHEVQESSLRGTSMFPKTEVLSEHPCYTVTGLGRLGTMLIQ